MELKGKSFAVVGASNNPEKFGYKVVEALKNMGAEVFPVNPKETLIIGLNVFSSVDKIKEKINVMVFVVPPNVTLEVLEKNFLKADFFWFQPGSFDKKVIDFCEEKGLLFENKKCIIVESKNEA